MSRIARPSEKMLAVMAVYSTLAADFADRMDLADTRVQVALLHVSTDIAMRTDTRDMGIMVTADDETRWGLRVTGLCDDCGEQGGTHNPEVEH